MDTFDFVIVGAGTAGCALAYRLAERGHTVCVLEAGPPDTNPLIRIPSGIMITSHNPKLTWRYEMEPSEQTKGRRLPVYFGKVLGGSSAINGMCYNRGQPSDFDNWARLGNEGWDYASVLPYFRKSEAYASGGEDIFRGRNGPIPIEALRRHDKCADLFIQAANACGLPVNSDYNGREQFGVSYIQVQMRNGKRWSSAHGYLHPAQRRFGVDVRTRALARRILVKEGRATGVEYLQEGGLEPKQVRSRLGTLVCAGSTASPKLLQLSGIGPAGLLQEFGIPVVLHAPGVGENLSDHYGIRMVARVRKGLGTINEIGHGLPLVKETLAWLVGKPSLLAQSSMSVFTFGKSNPASTESDYSHFYVSAALKAGVTRQLDDFPGITAGAWQQRPDSRGWVRIRSTSIQDAPIIQPNYLSAENDLKVLVAASKHCMAIFRSKPLAPIIEQIVLPGNECRTDAEWEDFVRSSGVTSYHMAGTCKMGPATDRMAVVDSRLRVRGIAGLHVVDGSVMPTQPSGNTNAAIMMIAEKAADMIAEDVRRPG